MIKKIIERIDYLWVGDIYMLITMWVAIALAIIELVQLYFILKPVLV